LFRKFYILIGRYLGYQASSVEQSFHMLNKSMVLKSKILMVLVVLAALFLGASAELVPVIPKSESSVGGSNQQHVDLNAELQLLLLNVTSMRSKLVS
jgi:hypothetical protein